MKKITATSNLKELEEFLKTLALTRVENPEERGDHYLCIHHKKIHKYTYHRGILFIGESLMLGFDTVSGVRAYCLRAYNNRKKCYG